MVSASSNPMKFMLIIIVGFVLIELMVLNFIVVYSYTKVKNSMSPILNPRSNNWVDILSEYRIFQDAVKKGKSGGFVGVIQETLERLFVIMPKEKNDGRINKLGLFGLDVSHSGEAIFIYRRIMSKEKFDYNHLVIDIGANDGLVSSNSFNFIQWGWNAILVEPQSSQIELAKKNIKRYIDPYREMNHTVRFVQAVLGDTDGETEFVITSDVVAQESHVLKNSEDPDGKTIGKFPSISVKTFVRNLHVPQFFGVLSIDAEGVGHKILHGFIDEGFRPAFIIYEPLHETESFLITAKYVAEHEYKCLKKRGWNVILEHVPNSKKHDNLMTYNLVRRRYDKSLLLAPKYGKFSKL